LDAIVRGIEALFLRRWFVVAGEGIRFLDGLGEKHLGGFLQEFPAAGDVNADTEGKVLEVLAELLAPGDVRFQALETVIVFIGFAWHQSIRVQPGTGGKEIPGRCFPTTAED
jgi:hypothetical protein